MVAAVEPVLVFRPTATCHLVADDGVGKGCVLCRCGGWEQEGECCKEYGCFHVCFRYCLRKDRLYHSFSRHFFEISTKRHNVIMTRAAFLIFLFVISCKVRIFADVLAP